VIGFHAYTVVKFFHVLFAIVWIGGGIMVTAYGEKARREKEPGSLARVAGLAEWAALRIFVPSGVIVFLLGLYLVHKGDWGWGHFWIIYALVAYAVSFLTGLAFLGPESGRIRKTIEAEGPESPAAVARINRILLVARIDLLLLVSIVFMMVTKLGQ